MPRLVEIAVAVPVSQTLTYVLPEELLLFEGSDPAPLVGRRVFVPLGRQRVTGYIVGDGEPPKKGVTLRNVLELLDTEPFFHSAMVPFFRWIADYYLYPPGLVIKAALPGGTTVKGGRRLVRLCSCEEFSGRQEPWCRVLARQKVLGEKETAQLLRKRKGAKEVAVLCAAGKLRCEETVVRQKTGRRSEQCYALSAEVAAVVDPFLRDAGSLHAASADEDRSDGTGTPRKEANNNANKEEVNRLRTELQLNLHRDFGVAQTRTLLALGRLLHDGELTEIPGRELRRACSAAQRQLAGLVERGEVTVSSRRIFRDPFGGLVPGFLQHCRRPEQLSPQQEEVLAQIVPAITSRRYKPFLLYGITGSGKTEVYLRAAESAVAEGRGVLVLVPEIALATQLEGQFVARFGDRVVLQHSGLSAAQKFDQYSLALAGSAMVVIGARSAVFAPLKDPGLIIVDEEHDSSYKQDDSFRYNGRDLAVIRALMQSCTVILGSATPAVTSFSHGLSGKYTLLTMDQRIGESKLPQVVAVDLSKTGELRRSRILSETLLNRMQANLDRGSQTILLMNRRGFSAALLCSHCGTPVQCPHCNVSLTLHKHNRRLLCHYCGSSTRWRPGEMVCGQCRSPELSPAGFGTERVEEEVRRFFPAATVRRIDSDTARDRRLFHRLLGEMRTGGIDILIGTQMIAKGHHFPGVTLVGVVWADGGMSMPDYKAAEKSFQLITQVTGRAGRGKLAGEVVIQTLRPDHYAIQFATRQQYAGFFAHEIELRRSPAFPPFVRLALLCFKGRVEENVRDSGMEVARFCRQWAQKQRAAVDVLGPAPSPIDRLRDNWRFQILLRTETSAVLHKLCRRIRERANKLPRSGVELAIDIDPENMM